MTVVTGSERIQEATSTLKLVHSESADTVVPRIEPEASTEQEVVPMTDDEFQELADLEHWISDSWWELGEAFEKIKEKKLYRQTKDGRPQTWEEYCQAVHDMTKQQVDKYIRAAEARRTLQTETKVSVLPSKVSQAVELSGLEPPKMAEVAEAAVQTANSENRKPTAKDYRQARAAIVTPKGAQSDSSQRKNGHTKKPAFFGDISISVPEAHCLAFRRHFATSATAFEQLASDDGCTRFSVTGNALSQKRLLKCLIELVGDKGPLNLSIDIKA